MAAPTLPRIAMPSAPPSSELVSEIAAAAPAASGGAAPTIRSVPSVTTGASPSENRIDPGTNRAGRAGDGGERRGARGADGASRAARATAGRTWRAIAGARGEPTMNPADQGSVHKPA